MGKNTKRTVIKNRKIGQIMGINIVSSSISLLLTRVEDFISDNHKFYIVTPNPEIVLASQSDNKLKEAINSADLSVPDGVGLKIAIPDLKIIKGRDLFLKLIELANKKGWKIFLLGGLGEEAKMAAQKLEIRYRNLKMESYQGPRLNNSAKPESEGDVKIQSDVVKQINSFEPQLLFVAFGNPKQEIWIHKNLSELNIGGAMAVGGAFRYVAGLSPLPPEWMSDRGFEWLWRLFTEPHRIGRIWNAVVVFPFRLLCFKFPK
jgi:N-acetylglucosaminyldiphosphoundecaprenol N-acetyl-beta-D-mannosaminyltransferase